MFSVFLVMPHASCFPGRGTPPDAEHIHTMPWSRHGSGQPKIDSTFRSFSPEGSVPEARSKHDFKKYKMELSVAVAIKSSV